MIKNVPQAIVGFNNRIGIGESMSNKYFGGENGTFKFAMNVVDNCRFENCEQLYVRKNSLQDMLQCKFQNCSFYNCSYISVGNETELNGCQIVNDSNSKYELFALSGKPSDNEIITNRLKIKDCKIEVKNNKPLIIDRGVRSLRHMVFDIENSQICTDINGVPFFSRDVVRDGESVIEFDDFIIRDSEIRNYVMSAMKGWSGLFSVVNSNVPIENGVITKETSFYNASFIKGDTKIHLDGVKIQPDFNSLPLGSPALTGHPATGTLYWQKGRPTWSNGFHWVDAVGNTIE